MQGNSSGPSSLPGGFSVHDLPDVPRLNNVAIKHAPTPARENTFVIEAAQLLESLSFCCQYIPLTLVQTSCPSILYLRMIWRRWKAASTATPQQGTSTRGQQKDTDATAAPRLPMCRQEGLQLDVEFGRPAIKRN